MPIEGWFKYLVEMMQLIPLLLLFLLLIFFPYRSFAIVSTSDPLWDWKYETLERLVIATGENTILYTRPISRLEMAKLVLKISEKIDPGERHYVILLDRLEKDLAEEIQSLKEGGSGEPRLKPLRWVRAKAAHADSPVQLENDYGFKGGDLSIRGEASTSGTWSSIGYELRPEFNLYRDGSNESELDVHSGYIVYWFDWIAKSELEIGKDSLWWGPGRRGNWVLTNNAPSFEMIKLSDAMTTQTIWPLQFFGTSRFTALVGKISKQAINYRDNDVWITEEKEPLFAAARFDFRRWRHLEIGVSQGIEFIDRGGRGYSFDYINKTLFPTYNNNEEEVHSGPVANRVSAIDLSFNIGGYNSFIRDLGLKGMKIYWTWGGETMVTDEATKLPQTCNTANLFGLYLDNGIAEFNMEYSSTFEGRVPWYDHYQFQGGYKNEGFVLGHPYGAGYQKTLYAGVTYPLSDSIIPTVYIVRKDKRNADDEIVREDDFGLSLKLDVGGTENVIAIYEHRSSNNGPSNNIFILELFYPF